MKSLEFLDALSHTLAHFPWRNTARALRQRFREDQLGLTASSLTFTTMLSLVPLFTVALAIFTAFPMFAKLQDVLQKWLIESLIPDNIARQVLGYLAQFSSKASKLGVLGLVFVTSTALTLIFTIDRTLNNIWRVKKTRSLTRRLLVYWAALTLGPLLLGASLTMTSYVLSLSSGAVGGASGIGVAVSVLEFALLAMGMAALYRYVPNTEVKWTHAWSGGLFVAMGIELAKKVLAIYLASVPTYSAVYGAFATFPILLLWIYVVWVIVLLGAVLAAYLPSLLTGVARTSGTPGWSFQLALEVLQMLHQVRLKQPAGWVRSEVASHLLIDPIQLEPVLEALMELDWVGQLEPTDASPEPRLMLLVDPGLTPLSPLVERLLLRPNTPVQKFWDNAHLMSLKLRDALE